MKKNSVYKIHKWLQTEAEVAAEPPTIFDCILINLFIGVSVLFPNESPIANNN